MLLIGVISRFCDSASDPGKLPGGKGERTRVENNMERGAVCFDRAPKGAMSERTYDRDHVIEAESNGKRSS
jgi:hypothetical protein